MAMDFNDIFALMVEKKGSDLFITAGMPPCMKLNGRIVPVAKTKLNEQQARELTYSLMTPEQRDEFQHTKECNFAHDAKGIGRFRVSAFVQRDNAGMVLRRIETNIPTLEDLRLPPVLADLSMSKRGLVVFVGATGTGKSTSLAAMVGHRNHNASGHIISIEDPIEFLHQHGNSIITQREVGVDTESYEVALKNTLRQAPDVILIGEVRTRETMQHAITFAETGHLVLTTLHANNANQALERIIHFFPDEQHKQVLMDLSLNLRGIVAQQLVPRIDGEGRKAILEVLLNTPLASDLIAKAEVSKLKDLMKRSREQGMITFDQALYEACVAGEISEKDAMQFADSSNEVRLMLKLGDRRPGAGGPASGAGGLGGSPDDDGMSLLPE